MLSGVSFINAERPQALLPQRSHSLTNAGKLKSDPVRESALDVERARQLLNKRIANSSLEEEEQLNGADWESREELYQSFARMIEWVEELSSLLQKAYDTQSEVETALMLSKSNLQMALANNEMLEDALKQAGPNVKDIGWRRLSERERLRQASKEEEETESISEEPSSPIQKPHSPPPTQSHPAPPLQHHPTSSLRFFNFPSLSRSAPSTTANSSQLSIRAESPTGTQSISYPLPHSRPASPTPSRPTLREKELAMRLEKEKEALKSVTEAKLALENELETLSQALFEEANKMVATSNRKLAETQEELHEVMEEREALRAALRIVEGENGANPTIRKMTAPRRHPRSVQTEPEDDEPIWSPDTLVNSNITEFLAGLESPPQKPHSQKFWNETSTNASSSTSLHSTHSSVRLSVMPQTPHSRMAVKNEFEKTMLRMERLIEDVEGNTDPSHHDAEIAKGM